MASATQARKPYRKAPPQHRETRHSLPAFREDLSRSPPGSGNPPAPPQVLQQQNEDLRRCLTHTTHTMETMETEFENTRHYMQGEMSRTRDDLEKMRDKFRRLQNSYTASQRANQDLEEKLHALVTFHLFNFLCKVERDKKTMDQEIVELTNRLVDAKNTIDKLEELNERYRQDCNLAVQLLKCNKSHFRNHKFADLPYELQEMVNKHMNRSLPDNTQSAPGAQGQDADTLSLTPADVVPTSVIARVLEKPEPLVLNSAQSSSSAGRPVAEDVFVHVDMTGPQNENGGPGHARRSGGGGAADPQHLNGACRSQASADGPSGGGDDAAATAPSFEKLNPYPAPPPPHPLYPGRKVIEFSSDDKVKIPKNSPLPNCTYATRQAISLSLVQSEEEAGGGGGERQRTVPSSPATQSSPFSSPPQPPSTFTSSGSSEEDLLNNWQRMFVEKTAPSSTGVLLNRTSFSSETAKELQRSQRGGRQVRGAYSDGEEGSSAPSWTASRESSLDTDTSSDSSSSGAVGPGGRAPGGSTRPQKSPKRMGVHHLHRKDSLTRAQEHGNLLD
uniref:Tight junction-associated protein 1 domain-containing protein n=1 Tax=Electrophorus electricus TaxID=8005 RepID=A0A4W4FQ21_ELEEL